jgi:hypothetical protein
MKQKGDDYKLTAVKYYLNNEAISFLEANPEKIDWSYLSENPNAIQLLETNLDKID